MMLPNLAALALLASALYTEPGQADPPQIDYLQTTYRIGEIILVYPPHVEAEFQKLVFSKVKAEAVDKHTINVQFKEPLPKEFILLAGVRARLVIVHPQSGEIAKLRNDLKLAEVVQSIKPGQLVNFEQIPPTYAETLRKKLAIKPDGPKVVMPRAILQISSSNAPTQETFITLDNPNQEHESQLREQLVAGITKHPHAPEPDAPSKNTPSNSSIAIDGFLVGVVRAHTHARQEALKLYDQYVDTLRLARIQAFASAASHLAEGFPVGHDIPVSQIPPDRQDWLRLTMRGHLGSLGFRNTQEFDQAWPNLKLTISPKIGFEVGTGTTSTATGGRGRNTLVLVFP